MGLAAGGAALLGKAKPTQPIRWILHQTHYSEQEIAINPDPAPYSIPAFINEQEPPSAFASFADFMKSAGPGDMADIVNEASRSQYMLARYLEKRTAVERDIYTVMMAGMEAKLWDVPKIQTKPQKRHWLAGVDRKRLYSNEWDSILVTEG